MTRSLLLNVHKIVETDAKKYEIQTKDGTVKAKIRTLKDLLDYFES